MSGAKTTLIIGATPDMIEVAKILGRDGQKIGLISRTKSKLENFKKKLQSADINCEAFPADVTESVQVLEAFKKFAVWSPELDSIVYNVGVASEETALNISEQEFHRVMNTNFFGFVNCFQLAHQMFHRRKSGHAVVISSSRALKLEEQPVAYAASKSSLQIYISALRKELSKEHIVFSELYLGRISAGGDWRWLTCEEIVEGVIRTLQTKPERMVIGEV